MARSDGREPSDIRPLAITPEADSWAEGAVTITMGGTRVLCTATIEERVPAHRRGTRTGWVTAEYGMLPRSTQERSPRERGGRVDGRSQEIQRLVARSLRAAVDMRLLGERTVIVDCDVIRADGGTRTASISGGFVALALACHRLLEAGMVRSDPLRRHDPKFGMFVFQVTVTVVVAAAGLTYTIGYTLGGETILTRTL